VIGEVLGRRILRILRRGLSCNSILLYIHECELDIQKIMPSCVALLALLAWIEKK
jgi:hypothetical protein